MNIQEQNLYIMSLMSRFLNDAPCLIDASSVSELSNACSLTREEAYTYILAAYCGIDIEGDGGELFNEYFLKMIRITGILLCHPLSAEGLNYHIPALSHMRHLCVTILLCNPTAG